MSIYNLAQKGVTITAEKASFSMYDIESVDNIFTLSIFNRKRSSVDVFILCDDDLIFDSSNQQQILLLKAYIVAQNPGLAANPTINIYDLKNPAHCDVLFKTFGLSSLGKRVASASSRSDFFQGQYLPVCDTHVNFDPFEKHPYLVGYNSENYDTTMLAIAMVELFKGRREDRTYGNSFTAAQLRSFNDELFTNFIDNMPAYLREHKDKNIRWARESMLYTGRVIDASLFNEKQSMVALKRLAAMKGFQVKESDKLSQNSTISSFEELMELAAYNVSDVIVLDQLFQLGEYSAGFDQKMGVLMKYPEMVFEKKEGTQYHEPDIDNNKVRWGRLRPDSTSAKFVAHTLCPYEYLEDIPQVSFMYPAEEVADQRGIKRFNVLEESKRFFEENITDEEARKNFDDVYRFYKRIEGQNFNDSDRANTLWQKLYLEEDFDYKSPKSLFDEEFTGQENTNLLYYNAQGKPTGCYATMSTGGVHGAEYNQKLHRYDMSVAAQFNKDLDFIKSIFDDDANAAFSLETDKVEIRKEKVEGLTNTGKSKTTTTYYVTDDNGRDLDVRSFIKAGGSVKAGTKVFKDYEALPQIFVQKVKNGVVKGWELAKRYKITSVEMVNHEDFTSYYPLLLINLAAFVNPYLTPEDQQRYLEFFEGKESYGAMLKDVTLDDFVRELYKITRNGFKLLLNAASGAADAGYDNSIRMNNRIVTMRCIGQLLTWRIGQAQSLVGAKVISTNTDGLYTFLDDIETNNRVLEEQAAQIHVDIEPERLLLVSKDSNNRVEFNDPGELSGNIFAQMDALDVHDGNASGSDLSCYRGPSAYSSLNHPAMNDYLMVEYLKYVALQKANGNDSNAIEKEADLGVILGLMMKMRQKYRNDSVQQLLFFQQVIAASRSSITYPFGVPYSKGLYPNESQKRINPKDVVLLQHVNRIFFIDSQKNDQGLTLHAAGAWAVPAASQAKRKRETNSDIFHHIVQSEAAMHVLEHEGFKYAAQNKHERFIRIPEDQDVDSRAIPQVPRDQPVIIENQDLNYIGEERRQEILGSLDYLFYAQLVAGKFNKNWKNPVVPEPLGV